MIKTPTSSRIIFSIDDIDPLVVEARMKTDGTDAHTTRQTIFREMVAEGSAIPRLHPPGAIAPALILIAHPTKIIVTPEEHAALREADEKNAALRRQLENFGHDQAKQKYKAAFAAYLETPSEEALANLRSNTGTEESVAHEYACTRRAIKTKIAQELAGSFEIVRRIYGRIAQIVRDEIEEVANVERQVSSVYGLPHYPSAVIGALHDVLQRFEKPLSDPTPLDSGITITALLSGLIEL